MKALNITELLSYTKEDKFLHSLCHQWTSCIFGVQVNNTSTKNNSVTLHQWFCEDTRVPKDVTHDLMIILRVDQINQSIRQLHYDPKL